jgi:site-specific DNA-methyltransferase (adenine-specific)
MKSHAAEKYDVMGVGQICRLDVRSIVEKDSFLFMWWVASMPEEALCVVKAWGFQLKSMTGFSWIKRTVNGKDHFGMGYYTRQQQEHCLIARRGSPVVVSHSVRQNIYSQVREHSHKPEEIRDRIVELVGDVPRLEMFAREKVEKWDAWGNAVECDVKIGDIKEKFKAFLKKK